jgi:hypothetical protein
MSNEAIETGAVDTVVAPEVAVQPAAPPPSGIAMTREEARAAAFGAPLTTVTATQAKADATGRLHSPEDGRFIDKPADEQAIDPPPSAEQTAETTGEPAAPADAAAPPTDEPDGGDLPEGFVRLEIPENDPLRAQGHESVPVPKGMEEVFKNLLNRPVRRKEVEAAQAATVQLETQLDQYAAALRASQEFTALVFSDPRVTQTYFEIAEDKGPEAARDYLTGLAERHGEGASKYLEEAQQARAEARHKQAAEAFLGEATTTGRKAYPVWNDQEYHRAIAAYASYAAQTGENLTLESFKEFADPIYVRHPQVRERLSALRQQREQERVAEERKKGADRERADLNRAKKQADENPLSVLPSAMNTGHVPAAPAAAALTYEQARRNLKAG